MKRYILFNVTKQIIQTKTLQEVEDDFQTNQTKYAIQDEETNTHAGPTDFTFVGWVDWEFSKIRTGFFS